VKINWLTVIVFVVGAVLYATYGIEDLWRGYALRRLARKFEFAYLRQRLPEALSLYGTPFAHRRFTWNVMDGELHRLRIVIFDCQVGEGNANWRRTVIAIRTGSATLDAARFDSRMKVENSGGWSVFHYPQELKLGLTTVKELRALLNSI
jgi:hypothetical protein